MSGPLAPIALFVYRRPEHTRRCIEALAACPEFSNSRLYIFSDGPRTNADHETVEIVRQIVSGINHSQVTVIKSPINIGLAASVIAGVTKLTREFGSVIVVEDDLIVNSRFLKFLNDALHRYVSDNIVMQVSGHTFVSNTGRFDAATFFPFTTTWGWASWRRAWSQFDPASSGWESLFHDRELRLMFDLGGAYPYSTMLERQMFGKIDSWGIRWNWSVFKQRGLVLYPPRSLVSNVGYGSSATHTRWGWLRNLRYSPNHNPSVAQCLWPDRVEIDIRALQHVLYRIGGWRYWLTRMRDPTSTRQFIAELKQRNAAAVF